MGNDLGQRYKCAVCGTIVLCIRAGSGTAECCEQTMELQPPRELPSAD